MGKASRRPRAARRERAARPAPAPFVARPFAGLRDETDWVAMREIVPAATATVRLLPDRTPDGGSREATLATVLPLGWPGLHRASGEVLVGLQSGSASGDPSRDLASALLLTLAAPDGAPVETLPASTEETPRLQDLLDTSASLDVQVHEGFDFWVGDADLDAEGRQSLEQANASAIPTSKLASAPSCYWCRIGERAYVRWVLPYAEDVSTDALARLHAARTGTVSDAGRLLGCFRSSGLLIPVWEVDPGAEPGAFEADVAALAERIAAAAERTDPLTSAERGARAGLTNRQVTLR